MISPATLTIIFLALGTYGLKALGPLILGGQRQPPTMVDRLAHLLPAPLLAALVVTSTVVTGREWVIDARLVGVVVAGLALWRRLPFVAVVVLAAVATATTRALT